MAYIDADYYNNTFHGMAMESAEFTRLADRASDIIDAIVQRPVQMTDGQADANVKKATAYEVEVLYAQGSEEALTGQAAINAGSESLGSYSVGGNSRSLSDAISIPSLGGIPVSRMTLALLRTAGLMCRWAYAGVNENGE